MTRDEFIEKYRGRLLLLLTEAWSCRKAQASDLGLLIDTHAFHIKDTLNAIYSDLCPERAASAPTNIVTNGKKVAEPPITTSNRRQ